MSRSLEIAVGQGVVDIAPSSSANHVAVLSHAGTVNVYDTTNGALTSSFEAPGAYRVAWAHGRFGDVTITVSGDSVSVWRKEAAWKSCYTWRSRSSVNDAAWAPAEFGAMLAFECSDGEVVILNGRQPELETWDSQVIRAHDGGCHAVSWCPCQAPGALLQVPTGIAQYDRKQPLALPSPRLVTCGRDGAVCIWRYLTQDRHWLQEQNLAADVVPPSTITAVAWAPNPGLPFTYVAAGTEDGRIIIWVQDGTDGKWNPCPPPAAARTQAPIARLSWSAAGTVLTATTSDGGAMLLREEPNGEWIPALVA
jgi:protein transport protein SEC13